MLKKILFLTLLIPSISMIGCGGSDQKEGSPSSGNANDDFAYISLGSEKRTFNCTIETIKQCLELYTNKEISSETLEEATDSFLYFEDSIINKNVTVEGASLLVHTKLNYLLFNIKINDQDLDDSTLLRIKLTRSKELREITTQILKSLGSV